MRGITWENAADFASDGGLVEPSVFLSSPEPNRWATAKKSLEALYRLKDDWDQLGADAPTRAVVDSAMRLLALLRAESPVHPPVRIVAGASGSVIFEWQSSSEIVEFEIEEPGIVEISEKEFGKPARFSRQEFESAPWDESWARSHADETSVAA